jgi:DNA-binding LytR/AlgR family response regulator
LDTRLKCLLLDDEIPGLSYLKLLCGQIPELEVVRAYNDPEIFLNEYPKIDFDLCFIDIEMPGINGIKIAELLNDKLLIFTTAYKEYATDAFDLNAVDYLVKPVKIDRLKQAVAKAMKYFQFRKKVPCSFTVTTEKGNSIIYFDQLLLVQNSEIDSRDKIAFLENGTSLILKNISFIQLMSLLPGNEFCRINKKELIALKHIRHFSSDRITICLAHNPVNPVTLSLGQAYRKDFVRKLKQ